VDEEVRLLYDYEFLLEKLYRKVPPKSGVGEFQVPEPQVIRIGEQTVVRNFRDIALKLKRDPRLVARYLQKELATAAHYDDESGQLVLNVKVSRRVVKRFLEIFLRQYVKCPTCGSVDTRLERVGRAYVLKCEACGAEQPVKPF
jgi:translation initiation factor 2 subunit 2